MSVTVLMPTFLLFSHYGAVERGHLKVAKALLEQGANPHVRNAYVPVYVNFPCKFLRQH